MAAQAKLRCPICDEVVVSLVISSRGAVDYVWRQRRCAACGETFTTREAVEPLLRPPAPHLNRRPLAE